MRFFPNPSHSLAFYKPSDAQIKGGMPAVRVSHSISIAITDFPGRDSANLSPTKHCQSYQFQPNPPKTLTALDSMGFRKLVLMSYTSISRPLEHTSQSDDDSVAPSYWPVPDPANKGRSNIIVKGCYHIHREGI